MILMSCCDPILKRPIVNEMIFLSNSNLKEVFVEVEVDKFDIRSSNPSGTGAVVSCFSIICQKHCIPGSAFGAR